MPTTKHLYDGETCSHCEISGSLSYAGEEEIGGIIMYPVVMEYGQAWTTEMCFPKYVCHSEECEYDGKPSITVLFEDRNGNLRTREEIQEQKFC